MSFNIWRSSYCWPVVILCSLSFKRHQCCRVWLSKVLQVCQSLWHPRLPRVRESASLRTCGQWVWSHTSCSQASPCSAASMTRQHSATSRTTAGSSERSVLELVAVNFCFIHAQELLFCLWPVHVNKLWWYHILEFLKQFVELVLRQFILHDLCTGLRPRNKM